MAVPVLRSYKLTHDSGFSPNPFWEQLTLATCKSGIRRVAQKGEWLAGFTSTGRPWHDPVGRERLIYLMQIGRVVSYADYFRSDEFREKIPVLGRGDLRQRYGDNMYEPIGEGSDRWFRPVPGACHDEGELAKDTLGLNALVSKRFVYFGCEPLELPPEARPDIPKGQSAYGHFTRDLDRARAFLAYVDRVAGLDAGLLHPPASWTVDQRKALVRSTPVPRRV